MLIVKGVDTVILHMPKCAGTSIRAAIIEKYPKYQYTREHTNIRSIPVMFKDYRRIGFCRNPIAWYESKYAFDKKSAAKGKNGDTFSIIATLSDEFRLSIDEVMPRLLDLRNFLQTNTAYLETIINKYISLRDNRNLQRLKAYSDTDENVSLLTHKDFGKTLYSHWHDYIGLNTAIVYKMDDDKFVHNITQEFPGINIQCHNTTITKNKVVVSNETKHMIHSQDAKYFDLYGYCK